MSGFRTPQYNKQGVGEGGRATRFRALGLHCGSALDLDDEGWIEHAGADASEAAAE